MSEETQPIEPTTEAPQTQAEAFVESEAEQSPQPLEAAPDDQNWWRSRITGHERVDPQSLTGNPLNHRMHPMHQRRVVQGSLKEFGIVKSVQVNQRTGFILDGHERVWQALDAQENGQSNVVIDVEYVDLSPEEEAGVLAILDASSELAEVDPVKLEQLLEQASLQDNILISLTEQMKKDAELLNESSGEPKFEDDIQLEEKFELVIECTDEQHQQALYERLEGEGLKCRILSI